MVYTQLVMHPVGSDQMDDKFKFCLVVVLELIWGRLVDPTSNYET